jgi:hypothetical protein
MGARSGRQVGKDVAKVNSMKRYLVFLCGLLLGSCIGIGLIWSVLGYTTTLLEQSEIVSRELNKAQEYRMDALDLIKRLEALDIQVDTYDRKHPEVIALKPAVNFLGVGGRWIILLRLDDKHRIVSSNLKSQPVGWP